MRRGRGDTDRHAGAIVETRIENGRCGRIEAEGPRDLNGCPIQCRLIEGGGWLLPDFPLAFDPDVTRPVNHDLADVLIFQDRFQTRQERAQVVHAASVPVCPAHIFPVATARQ